MEAVLNLPLPATSAHMLRGTMRLTQFPTCQNQFLVRSEGGEEWSADCQEIRERGSPLAAGASLAPGDKVLVLNGEGAQTVGLDAEVLAMEGQTVQISCPASTEIDRTWIPLGNGQVCGVGNPVSNDDLLCMCGKQGRKLQDASESG